MKKHLLIITLLCLSSVPVSAKNHMHKLDKKIAEIESEFKEDVKKIEEKTGLSPEMKQLKIKQKKEMKDLKIKQAQEKNNLKIQQKKELKKLKKKERQKDLSKENQEKNMKSEQLLN